MSAWAACRRFCPAQTAAPCGYAGCADYAQAIAGGAPVNQVRAGGEAVAKAAAAIMGVEAGGVLKRTAYVACQGQLRAYAG